MHTFYIFSSYWSGNKLCKGNNVIMYMYGFTRTITTIKDISEAACILAKTHFSPKGGSTYLNLTHSLTHKELALLHSYEYTYILRKLVDTHEN